MRNRNIKDIYDAYDYGPNELADLNRRNPEEYRQVVQSNLEKGDTMEKWQRRNLENAQDFLDHQRRALRSKK